MDRRIFVVLALLLGCLVFASTALAAVDDNSGVAGVGADSNILAGAKDSNGAVVKPPVSAAVPASVVAARQKLADGNLLVFEIAAAGIPIERVSDLLLIAQNSFEEALLSSKSLSNPDFSAFNQRMSEFTTTAQLAFTAHDELAALRIRMDKASKDIADMNEVNGIYSEAQNEFADQRFERVMDLISRADEKIIDLSSLGTRTSVIYEAAASNIRSVIERYWIEICIVIIVPILIFLIFRMQIKHMRLRAKIDSLEIEKKVLQEEIKKAQNEYFVSGKMSEGTYNTRVNVYGEMIRDLTREIALLKEQEQKINTTKVLNRLVKKKANERK